MSIIIPLKISSTLSRTHHISSTDSSSSSHSINILYDIAVCSSIDDFSVHNAYHLCPWHVRGKWILCKSVGSILLILFRVYGDRLLDDSAWFLIFKNALPGTTNTTHLLLKWVVQFRDTNTGFVWHSNRLHRKIKSEDDTVQLLVFLSIPFTV